jgi:hypothetical protein
MENKVFNSKVDWWLAVLIIFLFLLGIGYVISGIWNLVNGISDYWSIPSGLFTVLLLSIMVWPVNYTLTDDTLIVRFGIFRSRYKFVQITHIAPSHNPLSSPALSLDRLKIQYTGTIGFFMISPKEKVEFMKELAERSDHLVFTNGEVTLKQI